MTAGHLARAEATTLDPAMGQVARVEVTAPTPWMGHLSRVELTVPIALVANSGPDMGELEPFHTYQMAGSSTGGTVAAHSWRQVSGPTAQISGANTATPSVKVPGTIAGTVVVLGYTATGTNQTPSLESTVTLTVLPVTERAVIGGVEVPMELRQVASV